MPRPRHSAYAASGRRESDLLWALRTGPCEDDGFTEEDFRIGWDVYGEQLMDESQAVGRRPWGWWAFEAGEQMPQARWNPEARRLEDPHAETIRLAELGELTCEELAALREDANEARLRIGTASERFSGGWRKYGVPVDQQAVDLWEAVRARKGERERSQRRRGTRPENYRLRDERNMP